MYNQNNIAQQIAGCEQIIQQLMSQTQQASSMYQQMLHNEQHNAMQLEELAKREQQAVQIIQSALHGHQIAMHQMQQVLQMCKQLEQTIQMEQAQFANYNQQPYMQQRQIQQ